MRNRVIFITLISFSLLFTNCLTMSYHSPRVTEPNTFQLGGGIALGYLYNNTYMPSGEIFLKYGLPDYFDLGFHINTYTIASSIGFSVKKQFNLNTGSIDGVNLEYGIMGFSLIPIPLQYNEHYYGINLLKNNLSLQFRFKKTHHAVWGGFDPSVSQYINNTYSANLLYEFKLNNLSTLVFVGVQLIDESQLSDSYISDIQYSKMYNISSKKDITMSGGISLFFSLK